MTANPLNEVASKTPSISPREFANRLETIGKAFIERDSSQNLGTCLVDFCTESIFTNPCGTVACHGGWLEVLLPELSKERMVELKLASDGNRYRIADPNIPPCLAYIPAYAKGVIKLVEFLGFNLGIDQVWRATPNSLHVSLGALLFFPAWMGARSHLWGNRNAAIMFSGMGYQAFGFNHEQENRCTLTHIGEHYIAVAGRVRELVGDSWEV